MVTTCSVCDFGLSRLMNDGQSEDLKSNPSASTSHGHDQGRQMFEREARPIHWCAPESISNRNLISFKSDVFMFGCTLWEMFTRTKPFHWLDEDAYRQKRNLDQIEEKRKELVVSQGDTVKDFYYHFCIYTHTFLPIPALSIMFACLNDEPSHRPTMEEVLQQLDLALNSVSMGGSNDVHPSPDLPPLTDLRYPPWLKDRILNIKQVNDFIY